MGEAEDSAAAAYVDEYVVVANENEKCEDEAGSVVDDPDDDDDVNDLDPDDSEVWKARALSGFFASWVSGLWAEIDFRLHLHLHSQYYDYYLHVS